MYPHPQLSPVEQARKDIAKMMKLLDNWDVEFPKEKRSKSQDKVKKLIEQRRKSDNEKVVGQPVMLNLLLSTSRGFVFSSFNITT